MKGLNYSSITALLRRIHAAAQRSEKTSIPVNEILDQDRELRQSLKEKRLESRERRDFLRTTGALGLGAGLGLLPSFGYGAGNPQGSTRVAIIGGGAGGIHTAYRLWTKFGWTSTVYEANDNRIGGRMFSDTLSFPNHVAEWGGEFLSSEHKAVRRLARRLGLFEDDIEMLSVGDEETYWINGELYSEDDLQDEWVGGLFQAFRQARRSAPWQPMYNTIHTPEHIMFDQMTAAEWLDSIGYPSQHWIHQLLITDVVAEYGMLGESLATDTNSALNLIYLLGFSDCGSGGMPLAGTDERFRINGGNDQIIHRMVDRIPPGSIEYGHKLIAIQGKRRGPYTLVFEDSAINDVICDKLVLSLPLGLLREIDFDSRIWNKFSPEKQMAINLASTSDNGKLQMEFGERFWATTDQPIGNRLVDQAARAFSDPDKFLSTWEGDPGSAAQSGLMVDYTGGPEGRANMRIAPFPGASAQDSTLGVANTSDVDRVIGYFNGVWPSVPNIADLQRDEFWQRRPATVSNWHLHPLAKGGFTSPTTNTMTVWWGAQWETEKNIHFAGEAYDEEGWSYMDGAIRSGKRVAEEIATG